MTRTRAESFVLKPTVTSTMRALPTRFCGKKRGLAGILRAPEPGVRPEPYLERLERRRVEPQQGDEHEDEQDPAGQLHVLLRLVLSQAGDARKEGLSLAAGLGQDQQERPDEGQVAEEKLDVPQDAVGHRLLAKRVVRQARKRRKRGRRSPGGTR